MNRRAFSLAELLVVIGVLLLLAGLLFPVFQSAREGGRRSRCLTQMHQLGQSTLAYVADFGETYPMAAYVQASTSPCLFTLYHALVPYIKDKQIVVCPSDGRPVNVAQVFAPYFGLCPAMGFAETSYMANWCLFEVGVLPPWLSQPHQVISASTLEYPAQTVAFFDAVMTGPPGLTPYVQGRHLEIAVANFADGHSRALRTRQTTRGGSAWRWRARATLLLAGSGTLLSRRWGVSWDSVRYRESAPGWTVVLAMSGAPAHKRLVYARDMRGTVASMRAEEISQPRCVLR